MWKLLQLVALEVQHDDGRERSQEVSVDGLYLIVAYVQLLRGSMGEWTSGWLDG